jgi:hypothetical protein
VSDALRCANVAFVGDSVTRNLFTALVALLATPANPPPPMAKHADMHFAASGDLSIDFLWRPHPENVTATLRGWAGSAFAPDLLVTGVALWHVLHGTDSVRYEQSLLQLREAWTQLRCQLVRHLDLQSLRSFCSLHDQSADDVQWLRRAQ